MDLDPIALVDIAAWKVFECGRAVIDGQRADLEGQTGCIQVGDVALDLEFAALAL